ncbi:hypothetical protein [Chryseobacterium sp. AG363]|uniref:hypothetical protein n=1 Tax=Chryseobacterium sp. AG363 TaxID=2183997 RepID=UPI000E71068A|nr:hypothetical protein [Chryseobacterium sp. AG363]RKE80764.1 hypothetical protein DEU39_0278 [Chryseobacterium sp. AG363]
MFLFNRETLQPFDVILVRFPGNAMSKNIREKCRSNYSHAIIYIGDDSFIEGNVPVVALFSTHRYHFKDLENVKVIRLKEEYRSNFDIVKAENFLRGLSYCDYNLRQLAAISDRTIPADVIDLFHSEKRWVSGIVCTSMVTLPYYIGGIDISTNDEPYYAHFGYIENCAFFEDVTDEVFMEIEKDIPNNFDYLSMCETGSLLEKQSTAVAELNKLVKGIFADLGKNLEEYEKYGVTRASLLFNNWEDVFRILPSLYELEKGRQIDELVYNTIINTGYNTLWFEEVHLHHQTFFPLHHLRTAVANDEVVQSLLHYQFHVKTFEKTLERAANNEDILFQNFTVCPCKSNHVLMNMYYCYADILRSTMDQYKAISEEYYALVNKQ